MKKLLVSLLVLAMLLSVFAACGGSEAGSSVTTDGVTDTPTTLPETDPVTSADYTLELPEGLNFEGETFTFVTYEGGNIGQGWAAFFDVDEPESGNLLEEAAFARNQEVEAMLGVTIACDEPWIWDGTSAGIVTVIGAFSLSGKNTWDAAMIEDRQLELFVIDELVMDINDLPYVDLSKSYYLKEANDAFDLGGHLYFFASDIVYSNVSATVWLFNQDALVDLGYDENYLYDLTDAGSWTVDEVCEMIEGTWNDLNGDNTPNNGDFFGIAGNPYDLCPLWTGAGLKGAIISDDGYSFDYSSDLSLTVINKAIEIAESIDVKIDEWDLGQWENGRGLFRIWPHELRGLQTIEFNYGILPIPKFTDTQDTYYTLASPYPLLIPANLDNAEMAGAVIEAMSAGSHQYFVPAFYDQYLEQGVIRDDQSRTNWDKCLNEWGYYILTSFIAPDPRIRGYGPASSAIANLDKDFISTWNASKDVIQELCDEFFDWYLADKI